VGHILIKPVRDRDEYVYWSTIVEVPLWSGSRAEALVDLERESRDSAGGIEARLARADLYGSSALDGCCRWDDDALIYEQRGSLPRQHLFRAARLLAEGRDAEVWDLLVPFEDEAEVRRD
jgi:hypothetical protein